MRTIQLQYALGLKNASKWTCTIEESVPENLGNRAQV